MNHHRLRRRLDDGASRCEVIINLYDQSAAKYLFLHSAALLHDVIHHIYIIPYLYIASQKHSRFQRTSLTSTFLKCYFNGDLVPSFFP